MITKLINWYGKRTVFAVGALIIALTGSALYSVLQQVEEADEEVDQVPQVEVATVSSLSPSARLIVVGTVEAISQAELQSEAGGRVTTVNVGLGDRVRAGQIIAQLENANERAAVVQAEGAYEAAVAAASQGNLAVTQAETSLKSAQDSAVTTYKNNYTTAARIVTNTIDTFFSSPTQGTAGLRITASTDILDILDKRITLRSTLPEWERTTNNLNTTDDFTSVHQQAVANTRLVLELVDVLREAVINPKNDGRDLNGAPVSSYRGALDAARADLVASLGSLDSARSSLNAAREAVAQAEIGGTNATESTANAQVKQALGSLQNAQANLAKTIIRTPIAGEVNQITVNVGDFISVQENIAVIANNDALEVTVFVSPRDKAQIQTGQTVRINNEYLGTITTITNAVNPQTRKFEVKIATESGELTNGDTVTVELVSEDADAIQTDQDAPIRVPVTALKFTDTNGSAFKVEDGVLVSVPVEVGAVSGQYVEVLSGITATDRIVLDVRGLVAGRAVEAVKR